MIGLLRTQLLCALLIPAAALAGPAPSPELELSDRLQSLGSYSECAVEALRHAYLHPDDRERGFERAALCLDLAGRFADAERVLLSQGGAPTSRARFRLCVTEVFLEHGPDERCGQGGKDPLDALASQTPLMHALRAGEWGRARGMLEAAPPSADPALAAWRAEDAAFLAHAAALPRRSPMLAGALSALVPGLGRVYIGRWQDGLMSALLVGVPAGFAANGFARDGTGSIRGWILGTVAGVLYLGNVYGSAAGADLAARDASERLRQEVTRAYTARLQP